VLLERRGLLINAIFHKLDFGGGLIEFSLEPNLEFALNERKEGVDLLMYLRSYLVQLLRQVNLVVGVDRLIAI